MVKYEVSFTPDGKKFSITGDTIELAKGLENGINSGVYSGEPQIKITSAKKIIEYLLNMLTSPQLVEEGIAFESHLTEEFEALLDIAVMNFDEGELDEVPGLEIAESDF